MSTSERYHDICEGGGGGIMSTLEGVQYIGGIS